MHFISAIETKSNSKRPKKIEDQENVSKVNLDQHPMKHPNHQQREKLKSNLKQNKS